MQRARRALEQCPCQGYGSWYTQSQDLNAFETLKAFPNGVQRCRAHVILDKQRASMDKQRAKRVNKRV